MARRFDPATYMGRPPERQHRTADGRRAYMLDGSLVVEEHPFAAERRVEDAAAELGDLLAELDR